MEDKAQYIINNLRQRIIADHLDLDKLFKELDYSGDKSLSVDEFGILLKKIDKELQRDEIEYIFNKFDEDGSNSIELIEFKQWLQINDVRMN